MNKFANNVSVEEDPAYQDFIDAQEVAAIRSQEAESKARRKRIFDKTKGLLQEIKEDKPERGKVYSLFGGKDEPCIAKGNTWADSEVNNE